MTALRLQRARNRIWLDLRDGIDLKALARMDSKAAREEVFRRRGDRPLPQSGYYAGRTGADIEGMRR
jgi:hypothetical protein